MHRHASVAFACHRWSTASRFGCLPVAINSIPSAFVCGSRRGTHAAPRAGFRFRFPSEAEQIRPPILRRSIPRADADAGGPSSPLSPQADGTRANGKGFGALGLFLTTMCHKGLVLDLS